MIAITGGAGFIGSALLHHLNRQGFADIVVVDHLNEGPKWKNLVGARFRDYVDRDVFLDQLLEGRATTNLTSIVHLGACSRTIERDSDYLMHNNTLYTRALAEWCLDNEVKFIYASSAATYGDGASGYDDDPETLEAYEPLNMYGLSKHLFDMWARDEGWLDKMTGLKFFNVYGPGEGHKGEMRSLVHKAYPAVDNGGPMKLFRSHRDEYEDGEQCRDFIWIDDVCDVIAWCLDHPEVAGLFNVGTGEATSWNRLAKALFKACDRDEQISYIDMPDDIRDQYQYHTCARMDRLREQGYQGSFRPVEEGIPLYIDWLRNNPGR